VGTSALKASDGFSRLIPSLIVLAGYTIAFSFLSLALRTLPVGIVYAIWSGVGIVLISPVAYFVFHQSLDLPAIFGFDADTGWCHCGKHLLPFGDPLSVL
jgi:small multidrug resistance pump